ncbi:MAG: HEAT repeat domain-containing protein [Rhodobacteraceae bacterium]|nr:HEAT repeat domain-containing protein [Paracoccaceae bacterium]
MKTKAADRLSALLKDGIDVHRCAAARALGAIGLPQSTAVLVEALLDEDPDVRVDAATALAEVLDPKTARKLMDSLIGDPDADVKKAVITALVTMNYTPLIPILRLLTVSRGEEQIAWDEEEFYSDGWDSWVDIQVEAINGLGQFGDEEAIPHILEALNDEMGQDLTEIAYQALAQMGQAGAKVLVEQYSRGIPRLCRRLARTVGGSDNPYLDDLRGKMLSDETPEIRLVALQYLAADDARLAPLFGDDDASVRAGVVQHAGSKNQPLLWDLIEDPSPEVRAEVFKIIAANPSDFGDEKLVEAVKKAIQGAPEAAKQAALALFALQGPKVAKGLTHVLANKEVPREFRIGVLETLEKAGEVAVPALLEAAGDPDRQLRLASLTVLAYIASDSPDWPNIAGTGLLAALKGELVLPPEEEPEEEVKPEPEVAPEQAELDEIAQEIDDSLPLVVEDAASGSTLQAIMANKPDVPEQEPEEIVLDATQERLLAMTNSRKLSKRKVSWETSVAPYLDVQRFSARLLGQVVNEEVTASLVAILDAEIDTETRDAVLFSLARHGAETGALPEALRVPMRELLDSSESETRVLATRVLGWLSDEGVTQELASQLTNADPLVRVEAVQALDHRGVAGPEITAALEDQYLGVGIAAARALARLQGDAAVDALVNFAVQHDGIYRRDIGKLLGEYAPRKGAARLIDLLNNEDYKDKWLVAIDALAEIFVQPEPADTLLVA